MQMDVDQLSQWQLGRDQNVNVSHLHIYSAANEY